MVGSILRCFLEIVEGASLLRSRLNDLFNALHWQVDETARLLTAYGRHITSRSSALGRTIHRVEPTFLFIAQRIIKPRKRAADNSRALMVASTRCSAASRRPIGVSETELGHEDLMISLACDDAALRSSNAAS